MGRVHGEIEIGVAVRIWKADMKEFSLDSRKKEIARNKVAKQLWVSNKVMAEAGSWVLLFS